MLFSNMETDKIKEYEEQIASLRAELELSKTHLETYHHEVETLMRQLQRNAQNIVILSTRLREHGLDYKITPDEKTKLSTDNADIRT